MPSSRNSNHHRREICRVAARVFYEKGYDGASMQEIAEAVGLTKAGLYHHVGSKDRLLFEIMNYGRHYNNDNPPDTIRFNGKDLPAQGNEAEVRTFVFDGAGMKISP